MRVIKRILPAPMVSIFLLVLWLALARSASAGAWVIGLALALGIPVFATNVRPAGGPLRHPMVAARYFLRVYSDVLVSNFLVGRDLIRWRWRKPSAKFLIIPLDLRDPTALAVMAMVTTVVPGTVWSELALDRSALRLHVWDVTDDDAFIANFKCRYEAPLREIFE